MFFCPGDPSCILAPEGLLCQKKAIPWSFRMFDLTRNPPECSYMSERIERFKSRPGVLSRVETHGEPANHAVHEAHLPNDRPLGARAPPGPGRS